MRDVAHVEVALRKAYDAIMVGQWSGPGHWLMDPTSPALTPLWRSRGGGRLDLNAGNRAAVAGAVARCGGLRHARPDKVIAELTFGFWRHCTDSAHEKTVWVPYLHRAWPHGARRTEIERSLALINSARNRASHHEPLFDGLAGRAFASAHRETLRLGGYLVPELGVYLHDTTTVPAVLTQRP